MRQRYNFWFRASAEDEELEPNNYTAGLWYPCGGGPSKDVDPSPWEPEDFLVLPAGETP